MKKKSGRNAVDISIVPEIVSKRIPFSQEEIVGSLQEMQERYGYLPREAMDELARLTGIPAAAIYGVATFYSQFHFKPRGKYTVRMCRGTACHVKGARHILSAVSRYLGIRDGETTDDLLFSIETVACLGTCFLSPAMLLGTQYYGELTPERAVAILETLKKSHSGKSSRAAATKRKK